MTTGSKHAWTLNLWYIVSFFGWLYAAIAVYIWCLGYVYYNHIKNPLMGSVGEQIRQLVFKLMWYPIILLILWFANTLYLFWMLVDETAHLNSLAFFALVFPLFGGLMTSTAFLCNLRHKSRFRLSEQSDSSAASSYMNLENIWLDILSRFSHMRRVRSYNSERSEVTASPLQEVQLRKSHSVQTHSSTSAGTATIDSDAATSLSSIPDDADNC